MKLEETVAGKTSIIELVDDGEGSPPNHYAWLEVVKKAVEEGRDVIFQINQPDPNGIFLILVKASFKFLPKVIVHTSSPLVAQVFELSCGDCVAVVLHD